MNVQRVNLSHQQFGGYTIGNGAASNDSQGKASGTFSISGPNAPTAPTSVTKLVIDKAAQTAVITLGTDGKNSLTASGNWNESTETVNGQQVTTERLSAANVTAMKINGVDVAPVVTPGS